MAPAAEIDNETLRSHGSDKCGEFGFLKPSLVIKKSRGRDDMGGPCGKPCLRGFRGDASSDLKASGIGGEGETGGFVVARPEFDDVSAPESVAGVKFREPRRGMLAHEVGLKALAGGIESSPDDLFDPAFVEVDAVAKVRLLVHSGRKFEITRV